jgi:tRNA pseudouridine55 synthase
MDGFLVIDKPAGMTSRDVVNIAQRWFPRKTKIGHAGTLDPLATGVLLLAVGTATKLVERVQAMGKTYQTRILLGFTSDTDDADGTLTAFPAGEVPTEKMICDLLPQFIGEILQLPPIVSALKIDGRRAYDLARRGQEVKLQPRTVRVDAIRIHGYEWPHLDLEIDCGKGTYIRSIARDIGEKLTCGGLVQTLRRTRIGEFTAERGIGVDATAEEAHSNLLPMTFIQND